ncbi:lactate utilization protein C [Halobacillus litoralis]|uniref:Lactate utilization protein C n=1 Tax=Halobacillus litoralis TaxID=45668 RepID=A0A845EDI2_9BACI|nr:lactate utilization protein C [Halobacillus litoralis]MYL49761.1 lactate utilization protein C [Halobacillus litoralis]
MTVHNRTSFLDRVAENLGRERRTEVKAPVYSVQPQDRVFQGATQDELIEKLEAQCQVIHTSFKRTTLADLGDSLQKVLATFEGSRKVISAGGPRLDEFGMRGMYEELGKEGFDFRIWNDQDGDIPFAEQAGVGIVFSDITLAESGTVTLFNDKHNGRSISLLPETFIAIIPKSTLVPRMTQAARVIHEQEQKGNPVSSCVSFITGPSNSADIEMNLIVGVHGPVKATYILVEDL